MEDKNVKILHLCNLLIISYQKPLESNDDFTRVIWWNYSSHFTIWVEWKNRMTPVVKINETEVELLLYHYLTYHAYSYTNAMSGTNPKRLCHSLRCYFEKTVLYSFCSTSISVKVSIMSPTSMSPQLTSEMPHSRPVATSLASSL